MISGEKLRNLTNPAYSNEAISELAEKAREVLSAGILVFSEKDFSVLSDEIWTLNRATEELRSLVSNAPWRDESRHWLEHESLIQRSISRLRSRRSSAPA